MDSMGTCLEFFTLLSLALLPPGSQVTLPPPAPAAELLFKARITRGSTDCTWNCLPRSYSPTVVLPG